MTLEIVATLLTLFLGATSSYHLSRRKATSNKLLLWILSFRMMPPIAVIIPFYMLLSFVRLVDSTLSLILIYAVFNLPLTVWLVSSYMRTVSVRYDEMAMVDGFSRWQTFWKVVLPLSKPAIVTAGLLVFIFSWNEFLFALVLTGYNAKTLPVLATGFITQRGIIWGQLTATAVLITIPILILAFFMQKYFVGGITLGIKQD